jgi:agmatinase
MIVLKVPFDRGVFDPERKGCKLAPNIFEEKCKEFEFKEVKCYDDFISTFENIKKSALEVLDKNKILCAIGGDHSISLGLVEAFFEKYPKAGLVVLDAHFDCMDDLFPGTHEDWLKLLIKRSKIPKDSVFIFGVRKFMEKELKFANENFRWSKNDFEKVEEFVKKFDHIYVSIDIDCLDPSIAPGTGWPEKGGLDFSDILTLLKKFGCKIKGFDVVEINPKLDVNGATSEVGMQIMKAIFGFTLKE